MVSTSESTANASDNPGADGRDWASLKSVAEFARQGWEKSIEIQKAALDMANQQASAAARVGAQGFAMLGITPAVSVLEVAQQAVEQVVSVQKSILDLAGRQGASALGTVLEFAARQNAIVVEAVTRPFETQKQWMDLAYKSMKSRAAGA
jgi:hypothetical protein